MPSTNRMVPRSQIDHLDLEARIDLEARVTDAANGAVLSIDEVARAAGTVGYELMCALAARVPVHAA